MQTLRKRTSPCKYKNDPSRFLGEGMMFKAKLIGILEVSEARGDKMCQDALNDLKTAIRAAGEHKQRITIGISIDGLRLRDEKTGDCLYHHPVHKISFIAQDMSDSRAFGYIFGSPDTGHRFFGIKTDKTASQVVISMRDLFQVVFELKKKEIESAKHHSDHHQLKYANSPYMEAITFGREETEAERLTKTKMKYAQLLKNRCLTSKTTEASTSEHKLSGEAIADLLDLENELNSIQQGITQMEKITPSDPFGPLSKPDPYVDPFDDSFSAKSDKVSEDTPKSTNDSLDQDKHSSFFGTTSSTSKPGFFSQFSPGMSKPKADDVKWFDQETESLFNETVSINNGDPSSSPIALTTPAPEPEQTEAKKSPVKTDLFTELDPLGTGRVKPYVDKKDFFQELKNPPKKVLKELITENTTPEPSSSFCFPPASSKEEKTPPTAKSDSARSSSTIDSTPGFTPTPKYSKIDPFEDSDPFDKTDPFQEEIFPSIFPHKPSSDAVFDDKPSWKFDTKEESAKIDFPLFPSTSLRVSLPPEKVESNTFKSPPISPENSKIIRRKNYQSLSQATLEKTEDSPVHEKPFVSCKVTPHPLKLNRSPCKENYYTLQSPSKSKMYSSPESTTPDPPPRAKTSLFLIKPPPLPPKKASLTAIKPPSRPPSLEDNHYDYLHKKQPSTSQPITQELKCIKLKKHLTATRNSPPLSEATNQTNSAFPILPPPPNRKPDPTKPRKPPSATTTPTPGSILNLKLNQLDNTGLENLAITLGIPSENIYSMTLQELTKMLAEKYLIAEAKAQQPPTDSFEADFDANFSKMEANPPAPPSYDKYAVFKELMENEEKGGGGERRKEEEEEEEDKYAALRQLSLSVDKCENVSEEEEEEGGGGGGKGGSEGVSELGAGEGGKGLEVGSEELFPAVDEFSGGEVGGKENWATFDKSEYEEEGGRGRGRGAGLKEEENSPLSSDGKEDVEGGGFIEWGKGVRKEVPWKDDDESWDDNSPKESFCSDESSREERSPDPRRSKRYENVGWESERKWEGKGRGWGSREKWNEETEDEFEESWRKQKESSYDADRKSLWQNSYDSYAKRRDWCSSRNEPWEERHLRCYLSMRKRSESDNEYRKRLDSDASEKECVWTSQKNYPGTSGRSGKQKQYYSSNHGFRDRPEHPHESRTKHRKSNPNGKKRPSSASEPKRSYDKMSSPGEYSCMPPDKSFDEYFRIQFSRKEPRPPYYRPPSYLPKSAPRTPRGSTPPNKRSDPIDPKNHHFDYFEPFRETSHKHRNFSFDSETDTFEKPTKNTPPDPNQWASANGRTHADGFYSARAPDAFPRFPEDFKPSPKKSKENGKAESAGEGRTRPHLLHRQESSATLRKSDSINIFSRDKDPFEGDDFFNSVS